MDVWLNLEVASGLGRGFLLLVVAMMALTLLLRRVHPVARVRLRVAMLLQVAGLIGLIGVAGLLGLAIDPQSFLLRSLRDAADVFLSVSIVTVLGVIVFDYVLEPLKLRPPGILTDLILGAAYVASTIIVLGELGRDASGVLTTGAIATAAIGFSLQDTLRSVMGGMSIQMDRTIRTGDWIRVDSQEGRVVEIRWRQTSIVTRDGDTVVIPNSHLANTYVTVLGKHGGGERKTRRHLHFEVDHGVPSGDVVQAIEAALRESPVPGMAGVPHPACMLLDLRSAWQTFVVTYWLKDLAQDLAIDSGVRMRVITALQRLGVGFSFPTQSILLHERDASHAEREARQEQERREKSLLGVPIFAPLTQPERAALAERLIFTVFTSGETITRQGTHAEWLYIVIRGTAGVRVANEVGGPERPVASLSPGNFFGEMALLTGAPRSATVVAESDVACYKLDQGSFLGTIQARPEMAEEISRLLAMRRVELDAVREHLNAEAKRLRLVSAETDLLGRIREFFRIA